VSQEKERTVDIEEIDPGVRKLVAWLNDIGFTTTDSGDGLSKFACGIDEALAFPHVALRCEPSELIDEAQRLRVRLALRGITCTAPDGAFPLRPMIEASYNPVDGVAVIFLSNVSDAMLGDK